MNRIKLHNFDLRRDLTPDQLAKLAKANERFFEIAQNLERIKQVTQNSKHENLTDEVRALLIIKIRIQDLLNFKALKWLQGMGGSDIFCINQSCGCFSSSNTGNESCGLGNGER